MTVVPPGLQNERIKRYGSPPNFSAGAPEGRRNGWTYHASHSLSLALMVPCSGECRNLTLRSVSLMALQHFKLVSLLKQGPASAWIRAWQQTYNICLETLISNATLTRLSNEQRCRVNPSYSLTSRDPVWSGANYANVALRRVCCDSF